VSKQDSRWALLGDNRLLGLGINVSSPAHLAGLFAPTASGGAAPSQPAANGSPDHAPLVRRLPGLPVTSPTACDHTGKPQGCTEATLPLSGVATLRGIRGACRRRRLRLSTTIAGSSQDFGGPATQPGEA